MTPAPTSLRRNVPLAPLTTIGLGGPAGYYARCTSIDELRNALLYARDADLPTRVLGGGSNVLFPDEGYAGLILHIALTGSERVAEGPYSYVSVAAGETWDGLVSGCVASGLQGIECLSGIPGQVGATPIQNVGAYGQDVSESIVRVSALERDSLALVDFLGDECGFGYRRSRFKEEDADQYVITRVVFRLRRDSIPEIRYPELQRQLDLDEPHAGPTGGAGRLEAVRRAVLHLRQKKSMLVDPDDPHSRSVGSFFVNPVIPEREYRRLAAATNGEIPSFPAEGGVKVPAAWLVEHAGFRRGYRRGSVGISANHALALVNYGGTSREVLALASEIQDAVFKHFAIRLNEEPVLVPADDR